jgi:RNA polymerase sigma-70 factor (ECF subfamily)
MALSPEAGERAREAQELVRAARQGDAGAFEQLVRRYRSRVFALALQLTGDGSDADDITQEVFLSAYTHIRKFEGRSAFFTWLYRITVNRSLNVQRDRKRRRAVTMNDDRVRYAVAVDADGNPRLALELRESYGLLVQALDMLSPLLRTTLILTVQQGLSYGEAAVVLDTNERTVAWRVHEARKQLRRAVETLSKEPTPLPRHKKIQVVAELRRFLKEMRVDGPLPETTEVQY